MSATTGSWIRFSWPRRLGGRAVLVVLATILALHLGSIVAHHEEAVDAADTVAASQVAGRLATAARAITAMEPSERDQAAHTLSSGSLALHWEATPAVAEMSHAEPLQILRRHLLELAPTLGHPDLRLGYGIDAVLGPQQSILGTLAMADGSYLNFSAHQAAPVLTGNHAALISTSLIAAGVGVLAVLLMRQLTRPLQGLAAAVDRIGRGSVVPVTEDGPDEIQQLARGFNEMQRRIAQLITDRTHALAAVSHDLRTPITRLRLRAGFVADAETQQAIDADLDEMEAMIEATLHFLKDGIDVEQPKRIDLAAMLATLVDDATDAGFTAEYDGPRHLPILLRPLSIKRALSNLIGNATTYAGSVRVVVAEAVEGIRIEVHDEGPGIPEEALERVFEPFERLDDSRNRSSGGAGLGLSIAKRAIEREGGTITLANLPKGGLVATVVLPRSSSDRQQGNFWKAAAVNA